MVKLMVVEVLGWASIGGEGGGEGRREVRVMVKALWD
jgi:hypothetical protein